MEEVGWWMADTATKMATDGGGGVVDGRHSGDCNAKETAAPHTSRRTI